MNVTSTISTWTGIINQFLVIFTVPGAKIFIWMIEGWILCTVRRTVTGMLAFAGPTAERAHDAYHRFFPDARWNMAGLWRILTHMLIALFCRSGIITLALDDTLFHHSGKKQAGLIELAEQMINEVRVVGDGFYAPLAGKQLLNTTIISRIQRNAEIYDLPVSPKRKGRGRPRKKGKRLVCPGKMAHYVRHWQKVKVRERGKNRTRLVYTRKVLWYRVSHQPILLVISRKPGSTKVPNEPPL